MGTTPPTERSIPDQMPRPALLSLAGGSLGLPAPLTALVGRERELAVARELLLRSDLRLLTLTGPGGIGKTRLALRLAADLLDAFADGVRFVPLASVREAGLVAASIARALGVPPTGDVPVHVALMSALQAVDILLVVDNFEHVLAAASVLADLLASCPRLKFLVTSRVLLRVAGEHALAVPPLSVPDPQSSPSFEELVHSPAIQLFADRAQAVEVSFALTATTAPQVAEICRRLDGLPLAIELVAPRVRHLALPELVERLGRRLPLLTGGSRDQPSRLQTMRNAIAWSHDLLTPEARVIFRRLAVFTGGFSLEAAEYVGGTGGEGAQGAQERVVRPAPPVPPVLDGLATLIDASLLQTEIPSDGAVRYRMLETIREFALERLATSDEAESIRRAHATYYLALAERYELAGLLPDGDQAVALLETEHANLRAALGWLESTGERESFLRLATALGRFWSVQGHFQEGRTWLERALAHGSTPSSADRAKALVLLGMIEIYQGVNQAAENRLMDGLTGCRAQGQMLHAANALLGLGVLASLRGDHGRGVTLLEESLAAAHAVADPRLAGIMAGLALINLADTDRARGDHARAAERLEQALGLERRAGFTTGTILALGDLGDLARDRGDLGRALALYQEALGLVRHNHGLRSTGRAEVIAVIQAVAIVAVAAGQADRGARLLGATETMHEQIGLRYRVAERRIALEQARATARAALGEPAFAAAWSAGRSLQSSQAVDEALTLIVPPAESPGGLLTPREREILALLAGGQTDPAIAEALFIGVRTVETHVAHILAKLGVRTRTAAVSAAVAAGLVAPGSPEPAKPEATRSPDRGPRAND